MVSMMQERPASDAADAARTRPAGDSASILLSSSRDQLTVPARDGTRITFGRNRPNVDFCVGEDDLHVSRVQGTITHSAGTWWLSNEGRSPIRSAHALLHSDAPPIPLPQGLTPLHIHGARGREHLLELYVANSRGPRPTLRPADVTVEPRRWRLTADERLALVAIGQRYLLQDPHALPLSRQQAAEELAEVDPAGRWTAKKVEHLVAGVRKRLSDSGVFGLRRDEVGEPVGLSLGANLVKELTSSGSLTVVDLDLLESPPAS